MEFDGYEFNIQIWLEESEWNYSIIQAFENQNSSEVEPLFFGTSDDRWGAVLAVSTFLRDFDFEA